MLNDKVSFYLPLIENKDSVMFYLLIKQIQGICGSICLQSSALGGSKPSPYPTQGKYNLGRSSLKGGGCGLVQKSWVQPPIPQKPTKQPNHHTSVIQERNYKADTKPLYTNLCIQIEGYVSLRSEQSVGVSSCFPNLCCIDLVFSLNRIISLPE